MTDEICDNSVMSTKGCLVRYGHPKNWSLENSREFYRARDHVTEQFPIWFPDLVAAAKIVREEKLWDWTGVSLLYLAYTRVRCIKCPEDRLDYFNSLESRQLLHFSECENVTNRGIDAVNLLLSHWKENALVYYNEETAFIEIKVRGYEIEGMEF